MGRAKDKSRMWKLVAKVKQPQSKDEVAMGVCKTVNFEREGVITSVEVKYECDGMNDQSVMEGNSSKEAELNKTSRQTKAKQIHAPLISLTNRVESFKHFKHFKRENGNGMQIHRASKEALNSNFSNQPIYVTSNIISRGKRGISEICSNYTQTGGDYLDQLTQTDRVAGTYMAKKRLKLTKTKESGGI